MISRANIEEEYDKAYRLAHALDAELTELGEKYDSVSTRLKAQRKYLKELEETMEAIEDKDRRHEGA